MASMRMDFCRDCVKQSMGTNSHTHSLRHSFQTLRLRERLPEVSSTNDQQFSTRFSHTFLEDSHMHELTYLSSRVVLQSFCGLSFAQKTGFSHVRRALSTYLYGQLSIIRHENYRNGFS